MAPKRKRPAPLDDPPSTSSSDSESRDQEPQFVTHRQQQHQEEEEDKERASSEEEQEKEEDEEAVPNSKVKPIASKPIDQTLKPKAKPKPASKSASKRPDESNRHARDTKRSKKATEPSGGTSSDEAEENPKKPGGDGGEGSKKQLFQRVFSAEDEIAILKGLTEFASKTGKDPYRNAEAFHGFVKESLHVDTTSNQLKDKVRKLKKKFENKAGKGGKDGKGPSFSNPHDETAFDLAKKVWGNNAAAAAEGATSDWVVVQKDNNGEKARKDPKKENVLKPEANSESKEMQLLDMDKPVKFDAPLALREFVIFGRVGSVLGEDAVKERMKGIEASKRQELEKKWREILDAEFELGAKRAELLAEQARLMLD